MGLFWIGRIFLGLSLVLMIRISNISSPLDQISKELQVLKNQSTIDQLRKVDSQDFQKTDLELPSKITSDSKTYDHEIKSSKRDALYNRVKAKGAKKLAEASQPEPELKQEVKYELEDDYDDGEISGD